MSAKQPGADPRAGLLELYDAALPRVYGYLQARCGSRSLAEDLTAETFLAAVESVRRPAPPPVTVAWLTGVARHKLVDHWRRCAREEHGLALAAEPAAAADPWEAQLDALTTQAALARLGAHHQAALTLRYLDDLPVAQVAELLGRTEHATEALLVRARGAFRRAYEQGTDSGREDGHG